MDAGIHLQCASSFLVSLPSSALKSLENSADGFALSLQSITGRKILSSAPQGFIYSKTCFIMMRGDVMQKLILGVGTRAQGSDARLPFLFPLVTSTCTQLPYSRPFLPKKEYHQALLYLYKGLKEDLLALMSYFNQSSAGPAI